MPQTDSQPPTPPEPWQTLAATHRKKLDSLIPQDWKLSAEFKTSLRSDGGRLLKTDPVRRSGLLSDAELDVTESYSAGQLLQRLAWGDVRSVDVTRAFCKRAAIAQQLVRTYLPIYLYLVFFVVG